MEAVVKRFARFINRAENGVNQSSQAVNSRTILSISKLKGVRGINAGIKLMKNEMLKGFKYGGSGSENTIFCTIIGNREIFF
ncbi:MAG: hypothetical protein VX331_02010 [Candidatus Thermoplasmatota archaeon]|nr:hypothetical protein [Candidatus Thermoplasmatota archaeon]